VCIFKRGEIYHFDFMVNGKRYRGTTGEATKRKAQKVEQILTGEARYGRLLDRKAPTLGELGERFMAFLDASTGLDTDTVRYYKNGWRMLGETKLIGIRISDLNNDDVDAMGPITGSGYNINNARRTLRRMLSKAVEWKLICTAPRISLAEEQAREAVFTAEQQNDFLKIAPQPLRDVAMLIFDAGMRPDEVLRMRAENIDWVNRTIFIPSGKTANARRFVPLSDRCENILLVRCAGKREGWVFFSKKSKSGHLSPLPCNRQFRKVREALGLGKQYVLYTARHSFGTEIMEKTGNPKLVMKVMGHADLQTTMRYVHPETELVRDVVNQRNVSIQ
jgi:site-specific recombinase XerD